MHSTDLCLPPPSAYTCRIQVLRNALKCFVKSKSICRNNSAATSRRKTTAKPLYYGFYALYDETFEISPLTPAASGDIELLLSQFFPHGVQLDTQHTKGLNYSSVVDAMKSAAAALTGPSGLGGGLPCAVHGIVVSSRAEEPQSVASPLVLHNVAPDCSFFLDVLLLGTDTKRNSVLALFEPTRLVNVVECPTGLSVGAAFAQLLGVSHHYRGSFCPPKVLPPPPPPPPLPQAPPAATIQSGKIVAATVVGGNAVGATVLAGAVASATAGSTPPAVVVGVPTAAPSSGSAIIVSAPVWCRRGFQTGSYCTFRCCNITTSPGTSSCRCRSAPAHCCVWGRGRRGRRSCCGASGTRKRDHRRS